MARTWTLCALIALLTACGGGGGGGGSAPPVPPPSSSSPPTELATLQNHAATLSVPDGILDPATRRRMAQLQGASGLARPRGALAPPLPEAPIDRYFIHYGDITPEVVLAAKQHELAILHPQWPSITRAVIADIQAGMDPQDPSDDVEVLLYVSIGEDQRTASLTDAQMLADPRFVGDGTGPRVDPRGKFPGGGPNLDEVAQLGAPSPGGSGFASYYLDDNDWINGDADGLPDRNAHFGAAFVNAGDPAWFEVVDNMSLDGPAELSGLKESLTLDFGRGLGADGVFLDTIDTAAPNFYTDETSPNQSEYEWTAPGVTDFIRRLKAAYPDKLILQNRGLFFFDPRLPHFEHHAGGIIDFVLFESYRLNSNTFEGFDALFFANNKHNFAPKLMAEAGRDNGFRVLSLGYAEGPGINPQTLIGGSSDGFETLLTDIRETEHEVGFRHYLANAYIDIANTFVAEHGDLDDQTAPRWSSSHNDNEAPWPNPSSAPTPRAGIQSAVAEADGGVRVEWDVALDMSPVTYVLYYQAEPFDFAADAPLADARAVTLLPRRPDTYGEQPGSETYAYTDTIANLPSNTTLHLLIRAHDAAGNRETNTTTLTATTVPSFAIDGDFAEWADVPADLTDEDDAPDSAGPDFLEIKTHRDDEALNLYFRSDNAFRLDGAPTYAYSRTLMFIDVDQNPDTGYPIGAIGSDLVLNGAHLFGQSADSFNTGFIVTLPAAQSASGRETEIRLPFDLFSDSENIDVVLVNDETGDYAPNGGQALTVPLRTVAPPAAEFAIDGMFDEWQPVAPAIDDAADAPDSGGPDWQQVRLHCTDAELHIEFGSDDPFNLDGSPDSTYSRTLIFFDTDESPATGFSVGGLGSDVMVNGAGLYRQSNTAFNDGAIGSIVHAANADGTRMELSVPRSALGPAEWVRVLFVNDETFDLAPDLGEVLRLHLPSCSTAIIPNTEPPPFAMDGGFDDWATTPVFLHDADDSPPSAGPNWRTVHVAHDEDHLYISADAYNSYNLDGSPDSDYSRFLLFVDVDGDDQSGYAIRGLGSDIVINDHHGYSQSAASFATAYLGSLSVGESATRVEMALPRAWLDGATEVKLLFLNDETFDTAPQNDGGVRYQLD